MKTFYESELKELAGKRFESVKELEKAEAEVSEKIAAKQKAAELRKSDSDVVKAAIIEVQFFEETENANGGKSIRFPVFKGKRFDKNIPDY